MPEVRLDPTTPHLDKLIVASYHNPQAILFKGKPQTTVSAWVCGFIEYYADNPAILVLPPP
ncbi:hypothetical protein [Luteolibacter sp. Populi]|uniref:hypothetical protein n=1 Tax=Luteolibacter sp. Populi TaxID=3230487 RepID=UPI0034666254